MRSNKSYIFWYRNVSNFSMTLFLPLCLLLFYNISTYVLMKKRFANIASSAGAISEANNNPSASANGFVNNNNNNYNSNSGKPSILRAIKVRIFTGKSCKEKVPRGPRCLSVANTVEARFNKFQFSVPIEKSRISVKSHFKESKCTDRGHSLNRAFTVMRNDA